MFIIICTLGKIKVNAILKVGLMVILQGEIVIIIKRIPIIILSV